MEIRITLVVGGGVLHFFQVLLKLLFIALEVEKRDSTSYVGL